MRTKLRRRLLLIRELGLLVADEVVVMLLLYLIVLLFNIETDRQLRGGDALGYKCSPTRPRPPLMPGPSPMT